MSQPTKEQITLMQRAKDETIAENYMSRVRQRTCAGSNFFLQEKKPTVTRNQYKFIIQNTGCKNSRRHASKWCQKCSDEHHGKN